MPPKRSIDASHLADLLDVMLDQIADTVVERLEVRLRPVVEELVKRLVTTEPAAFTTSKAGPHLPGKSRRWMLDHVRSMPGARRVGRDWQISASDYRAWLTAEDDRLVRAASVRRPRRIPKRAPSTLDADGLAMRAQRALRAAGFRPTK